ncbi:MAG: alcohol dehydrogenase catalytic domain-containing protein [Firmicutes bacterium]|nr:alcohol dehydrogenase catalytic domain-containing protein [Bacillota bacterium]
MKALIKERSDQYGFTLCDIKRPAPADNQVLIKVKAVGICGTDVHIYKSEVSVNTPLVIGHEFSGVVEETGPGVRSVSPGDRVVSRLNIGVCGKCRACLSGNPHMCAHRTCPGFVIDGAYAEYIAMEENQLIKIGDNVDYTDAALTEPMAIVAHALLERTAVESEDNVVIFGPGPIGLIALQMAKINGAAQVIVIGADIDEALRIPAAKELGADLVINCQKEDAEKIIFEATEGKGADLVVEASGAAPAANLGIHVLRKQGRMCVLGLSEQAESRIAWRTAVEKSHDIIFSYSSSPLSWNKAVSMLNRGVFKTKPIITHTSPLENYESLFEEIARGNVIKGVLIP